MKYRVRNKNNIDQSNITDIELDKSKFDLSMINPTTAVNPTAANIANPKFLGIESLSDLPLELKKPYLLSNLTFCTNFVTKGIQNSVIQKDISAIILFLLKYSEIAIPMVIPSQNIIFQKLSLLSRALIQFILICVFRVHNHIVTTLKLLLKKIKIPSLVVILLFSSSVANAQNLKSLISDTEKQYAIPQGLLHSIALVESQINPYAINVKGRAIIFNSKAAVLEAIEYYRSLGVTNIDIGIMQINYRWHGKEFANLSEMLDVNNNVEYAAKLLTSLYKEHGSWHKATRLYHSATPEYHKKYSKKIITAWLKT